MDRVLRAILLMLGCGVVACASDSSSRSVASAIANPTGDCVAPDDGARPGYQQVDNAVWLMDCDNPLQREYWRVFAESEQSAYVIPRPDGAAELAPVCSDPAHELRPLVDRYLLCAPAGSPDAVAVVNHMLPEDALAITHFMHGVLRFQTVTGGIAPYPLPSDIIDACSLSPGTNSTDFEALCERERQRLASGQEIAFSYEGAGALELVAKLNELYGVR